MEPPYKGHVGTIILVLTAKVFLIQRSFNNTLQYYTGTQNGVLIIEVSTFQRFVIERFHCTVFVSCLRGGSKEKLTNCVCVCENLVALNTQHGSPDRFQCLGLIDLEPERKSNNLKSINTFYCI